MIWPGQTRAASASLPTTPPRASINAISTSKARAPTLVAWPSASSSRRCGNSRKRPNATSTGPLAAGSMEAPIARPQVEQEIPGFSRNCGAHPRPPAVFPGYFAPRCKDDWPSFTAAETPTEAQELKSGSCSCTLRHAIRQRKSREGRGSWTTKAGTVGVKSRGCRRILRHQRIRHRSSGLR